MWLAGAIGKHGDDGRLNGLDTRYNFSTGMHTGLCYGFKIWYRAALLTWRLTLSSKRLPIYIGLPLVVEIGVVVFEPARFRKFDLISVLSVKFDLCPSKVNLCSILWFWTPVPNSVKIELVLFTKSSSYANERTTNWTNEPTSKYMWKQYFVGTGEDNGYKIK